VERKKRRDAMKMPFATYLVYQKCFCGLITRTTRIDLTTEQSERDVSR
jgi:hypothetical protein